MYFTSQRMRFAKKFSLEIFYCLIIFALFIYSFFHNIPTDKTPIGISSDLLSIGDRGFYINDSNLGFGYETFNGNFLYPYILKIFTYISQVFGEDQYSQIWNFIAISSTSIFSIITLFLLRISSYTLFNERVAKITSLLYIINPYTYFYSLSGGVTNYVIIGVALVLFIFSKMITINNGLLNQKNALNSLFLALACIYLSCLRPTAILFSLTILVLCSYLLFRHLIISGTNNKINTISLFINLIAILICIYNLNDSINYSIAHISYFSNEGGEFFGYSRDLLRDKLDFSSGSIIYRSKMFLYYILWKLSDFVSGISDLRDTHNAFNIYQVGPFLIRVVTGLFILYPINLLSFIGILMNIRSLINNNLYIILIASFIAVSPSLLGVAMARYLIMFYSPFLIFAAKTIDELIFCRHLKI